MANIGNSVDYNYNELLKARIENVLSLPAGLDASQKGYVVYYDNTLYFWTGSLWIAAGGSVSWGDIGGFIANQPDLANELAGKEPVIAIKCTAFNKDFGSGSDDVAVGNHGHADYALVLHPHRWDDIQDKPTFGQPAYANFGTGHDNVSRGDHEHEGMTGSDPGTYKYYGGTGDNQWTEIFVNNIEGNRIFVPSGQAWSINIQASAKMPSGTNSAAWNNMTCLVDNTGGTVAMSPASLYTTPGSSFGDGTNWGVNIAIDLESGAVQVLCRGNLNVPTLFQVTLRTSQVATV